MGVHRFEGGGEEPIEVRLDAAAEGRVATVDDESFTVAVLGDGSAGVLRIRGGDGVSRQERVLAVDEGDAVSVWWRGRSWRVAVPERRARRAGDPAGGAAGDEVTAPMPGTVLSVAVAPGDTVARDAVVVVMESMKMEMSLPAPRDAVVAEVLVTAGEMVELGRTLVRFEPAAAGEDAAGVEPGYRGPAGG